jgi:hypothetical protein
LSYDPVSTLTRFAGSHGITYPLLSDEGSAVITELGILNVTLDEERAAYDRKVEERHRGIPYPGSFVLDEDGILVGKRLEQSHRIRPTANTLMTAFFGSEDGEPAGMVSAKSPGVQVAAWLDTQVVSANQQQDAHVRFVLEPDVHLYTEPVPSGFRAVSVQLTGDDAIHVEDVEPLEGHEFSIAGLDETFYVLENTIDIAVPFFLLTNRDTAGEGARSVALSVEISYQACTGDECFMPETINLDLELNEAPNPGYETKDLAALAPLVMRRIVEAPKTEDELLGLVNAALVGVGVDTGEVRETLDVLKGRGLVDLNAEGRWYEVKGA